MCNKLKVAYADTSDTEHIRNDVADYPTTVVLYIKKLRLTNWSDNLTYDQKVSLINTFIANNPIEIIYELATPTETPFTSEQLAVVDLYTTQDYCNISCDNKTPPLQIDVDYKELVDSKKPK